MPASVPAAVAAGALAAAKQTAAVGSVGSTLLAFMGKSKTVAAALAAVGVAGAGFGVARLTKAPPNIETPAAAARVVSADRELIRASEQLAQLRTDYQALRDENRRLNERLRQALEGDPGSANSKVSRLRDSLKRLPEQAIPRVRAPRGG